VGRKTQLMIKGIMEIDFSETVSGDLLATLIRRRELVVRLNLDSNISSLELCQGQNSWCHQNLDSIFSPLKLATRPKW